jgi:hypothetical protein
MATESIVAGLFGPSPEELQRQRMRQQQEQQAVNFSNLTDPRAFMAYVGSGLGSQLGGMARNVGYMLGGRTSEEVRTEAINQAYKNVISAGYKNDWEKLDALANELESKGLYSDASKARKEARALEATSLTTQKARKELEDKPKLVQRYQTVPDPMNPLSSKQVATSLIEYKGGLYSIEEFQKQFPQLAQGLAPSPSAATPTGGAAAGSVPSGAVAALQKKQAAAAKEQPAVATGADTRIDPYGGMPSQVRSPASPAPAPSTKQVQDAVAQFSKEYNASTSQAERLKILGKYRSILSVEQLGRVLRSLQEGM